MKSFYHILFFLGVPLWLFAQTTSQNYIVSTVPVQPVSDPTLLNDGIYGANSNSSIQYFDGLGRLVETAQKTICPSGNDLVNLIEYDGAAREYRHWLPISNYGYGSYVDPTVFTNNTTSLYNGDAKPYAETILEASSLNRLLGQRQPGADWNAHPTGISYQTNGTEVIYSFFVNSTTNQLQRSDTNYPANTLYKTVNTDEDGKISVEYKDKQEHIILKSSSTNRSTYDVNTYYVYNDLGQLSYVIPPKAVDELTADLSDDNAIVKQYCYLYKYDEQGNNTVKRLPGCDYQYMVYDKADRLVLLQDGNQRAKIPKQWTITKYDVLGRILYTGIINRDVTQSEKDLIHNNVITEVYDGTTTFFSTGYSNNYFTNEITPLTVNYYDNYNFLSSALLSNYSSFTWVTPPAGYDNQYALTTSGQTVQPLSQGLQTGSRTYILDKTNTYLTTALYYDKYGRVVQSRTSNQLGGYDISYNHYDFPGKILKTRKEHNISGQAVIPEVYRYAYDKAERLLLTRYKLGASDTITLAANSYDELGRVITKTLGGIDATTYTYNIRSWTTGINGSRFAENLYYNANTVGLPNFTPAYNGNIAGMQWSVASEGLGYNRAYTFGYDGLNRLLDANYCGFNGSTVGGTSGRYDEHMGFDKMGNFAALTRNENGSLLNNLSFAYTGNQLKKVDNAVSPYIPYGSEAFNDKQKIDTEYLYDQNGSTTADVNTGISLIQYNLLNLPDQIQFTEGHKNIYTYDASGRKLEAVNYTVHNIVNVPINTISTLPSNPSDYTKLTTDYVGNMIYENGSLKQILLPEGYYQGGVYYYYLKDHLGDNRVVINSSGSIIEKSHYYPSGMRFSPESTSNSAALPYRYNGKELEAMNGLNQYDYGARRRGAGLPIWTAVDPLAEKYYSISPYVYCANNPVNLIDQDGRDGTAIVDKEKRTISINQTFYYDNTDKNLSDQAITQDRTISGGPMDGTTFTAETKLASKNGYGAKEMTITDAQGNEWTVSYQANFVGLEGGDAVNKALEKDPTANKLTYNPDLSDAGTWNGNNRTLTIGVGRRMGAENAGGTTIHEMGHSWGLPHDNQMPNSPIYGESDNGASAPPTTSNGIMSYSGSREIKQYEVQYGAGRIINTANSSKNNIVNIHVVGSYLNHKIVK